MEGPKFLKEKYNLHNTLEIKAAANRTEKQTGERVSQKPAEQIQNYLDRFKEIVEREDPELRERGIEAIKKILHKEHVIAPEDIPESYFRLQQQIAREQGHGDIEITEEKRQEAIKVIESDQEASLDQWIDYLASQDALYPDWTKYWAMRSVTAMSSYDKEKHEFGKRTKDTTAPFPDLNREALAYVVDVMEKKKQGIQIENPVQAGANPFAEEGKKVTDEEFQKLLNTENFAKYYAFAIEHVTADNSELYKITDGEWRVFKQTEEGSNGGNANELSQSLQGHGTGWCTAGESTAANQLSQGDFYVYYSTNALGEANIPRLAIRMTGDRIAEIRGVAPKQEIDPYISPVLEEKMSEFGEQGEVYKTKSEAMRRLTKIDQAQQAGNITFSPEDLRFLYEVEGPIEGFGYEPDPRIKEIKKLRNWKEDMGVIYEISSDNELIVQLLEKGEISKIREHINSFENLSADTADRLIVSGNGSLVAYHFDQFETLNRNDIAQRLIDTDQGHILVNRLFEFEDLNHVELASTLIEKRQGFAVARNLHDFEGLDSNDIVQRLIDTGQGEALVSNFEKFPSINHLDTALKLLDTGQSTALARNLHNFEGLTADVAYRLVREQYGYSVSNDLDKFADIDQNEIAHQMIETGQAEQLVKSLKNFKDIDHTDIAIRIIESGHAKDFLENLESFADIDEAIVVSKLIDREDYQLICWKIGLFNNIDKSEIAKRLISLKQGALVSGNLDNFGDINHEEVTTQLIETGQVKELLDNFSSFSRVQNRIELLQQCVEAGYVEELLRKLERKSYYGMNEVLSQLSIAEMLLETGHDKELFNNLDKFDNIPRLARRMMASGHESVLAENLSLLRYQSEELLPKEIAYQLFEGGHYDDVLYNMEVFDSVDKNKIFDMAMEAGQEKLVLRYLEKFIGLESQKMTEVFKKIIESGAAGSVGWRLEHWPGTLEPEIADLLIKNHESWNVVCYPERFKGLDQAKIAQDLIANNQAGYVSLLPKFSEFDQAELSRQMIDSGQVWAVVSHLKEFSHLGYQNAFRLLRKGKILPVLANLKSFRK